MRYPTSRGFRGFNFGSRPALWLAADPSPSFKLTEKEDSPHWPPFRSCLSLYGIDLQAVFSGILPCACFTIGINDYDYTFSGINTLVTVPSVAPGSWVLNAFGSVTGNQYDTFDGTCTGTLLNTETTDTTLLIGCDLTSGHFTVQVITNFTNPAIPNGNVYLNNDVAFGAVADNQQFCPSVGNSGVLTLST